MVSIERLRNRLPLVVFVFLVLLVLMVVGVACACLTDHPMQAIDRAVSSIAAVAAVIELWSFFVAGLFVAAVAVRSVSAARGRASPALLQRFLL